MKEHTVQDCIAQPLNARIVRTRADFIRLPLNSIIPASLGQNEQIHDRNRPNKRLTLLRLDII